MSNFYKIRKVLFLSISLLILSNSKAFCDDEMSFFSDFKQGHWRFEGVAGIGLNTSEDTDRKGDYYFASSIDYEWPIYNSTF